MTGQELWSIVIREWSLQNLQVLTYASWCKQLQGCGSPLREIGASTSPNNIYKNCEKNKKPGAQIVCLSKSVLPLAEYFLKMRLAYLNFCS